jgi:WbqC-like protein
VKTVAIVQSCYIPWKGYFDLIGLADEFIVYDDRQYTKNDWRNRNRIKTPHGLQWLTIPVASSGRHGQRIDETEASDLRWPSKHWKAIAQNYSRAPYFGDHASRFERLYADLDDPRLATINHRFIVAVCEALGITTAILPSTAYPVEGGRSERVLALCRAAGATRYLTGPAARDYLDEALFEDAGIDVEYMSYEGYPEYPQLYPPFEHSVTALDLIFNVGPDAGRYLKSVPREAASVTR